MRVLIVDGHPGVLEALSRLLRREEHIDLVLGAETRREAVAGVLHEAPDVVVMDTRLPDGSGIDACREIRSRAPSVKVILLASSIDEDTRRRAHEAGASALLFQQLDIQPLLDEIRSPNELL